MIDRYGHQDDAIERQQARMQRAFARSIAEHRAEALRMLEQLERGHGGNETDRCRD